MRISWITSDPTPSVVYYGTSPGASTSSANGTTNMYHYVTYRSGEIHNVVIGPLKPNTVYYYRCGLSSSMEFSFKTPPSLYPIKFAIIGRDNQSYIDSDIYIFVCVCLRAFSYVCLLQVILGKLSGQVRPLTTLRNQTMMYCYCREICLMLICTNHLGTLSGSWYSH